jgi:hypothetical protein
MQILVKRLRDTWNYCTQGLSAPAVFIFISSTLLLILFHDNFSASVFRANFLKHFSASDYKGLYPAFYWHGGSLFLLGIIPLLLGSLVIKRPIKELGISLGDWRFGLKTVIVLYLMFLPILFLVSCDAAFQAKYPMFADAKNSVLHFLIYEGSYITYFIGWEFIFRGYMLFGLKPAIGLYSVFVQTIPFAIMHFGKPQIETLSAVFAGIILGYLALRTRSFWYGWLLHCLVAVTIDLLAIYVKSV